VKYTDDLVLLAKKGTVLQDMIDRIIEIGICDGLEISMIKTELKRFQRQPSPIQIMVDQNQLHIVKYEVLPNCFGSMITTDIKCIHEIK
jgi:hypothetical protein